MNAASNLPDQTVATGRRLAGLLVAVFLQVSVSPTVAAASFRPVPVVPEVPPAVTSEAERKILLEDRNRMRDRRSALIALQAEYRRDCAKRRTFGNALRRHCSFRLQEVYQQAARFRSDIDALRARFITVEQEALRRPDRAVGERQKPNAISEAKARLSAVRDLISQSDDDWHAVLARARRVSAAAAGNPVQRDAAAYLRGVYEGEIAADALENPYYKHGVRRWLTGDYWSAALSFARAARDNPQDKLVFRSFAVVSGRQHISPACVRSSRCVSGDITAWVKRFGDNHAREFRRLTGSVRRAENDRPSRQARLMLGAIVVFAVKHSVVVTPGQAATTQAGRALELLRRREDTSAIQGYIQVWRLIAPRAAALFFEGYSLGSGTQIPEDLRGGVEARRVDLPPSGDEYLTKLRKSLWTRGAANPFSGALTRTEIIRLQR